MKNVVLFLLATGVLTPGFAMTNHAGEPRNEVLKESKFEDSNRRTFSFEYGATIEGVEDGAKVRVWVPIAPTNDDQVVEIESKTFPAEANRYKDSKFENEMYYFETDGNGGSGIGFNLTYNVERSEVRGLSKSEQNERKLEKETADLFLQPNSKVPTTGKSIELFEGFAKGKPAAGSADQARQFYDWVYEHMTYDKSKPGYGNGDVLWACDSKTGNCTDFHSLFISIARNKNVPAKFEIGFPIPEKRGEGTVGGYHCWAKFYLSGHGWVPVDISEADKHPELNDYYFGNLTENRVHFSTGRDIVLNPKQDSEALNYFVYPHVEVDGKVWPKEKIKLNFSYKDK